MSDRHWIKSSFEKPKGRWAAIYATMNPEGHIFMTSHTFWRLGEPSAVFVLWDKLTSTIGLQPTHRGTTGSYPLLSRSGHGGRVVRIYSFMQEFGVRLGETVRFTDAHFDDDGILILDLRKVRSAAKPKRRAVPFSEAETISS